MTGCPPTQPTPEERAAAVEYHAATCCYNWESECPLTDFDPEDRYLPEDLENVRTAVPSTQSMEAT